MPSSMIESSAPRYAAREELASSLIHGVGIALSISGLAALAVVAHRAGSLLNLVSVCIYGASLVMLYSASTLYHATPHPNAKRVLRIIDHVGIFLLIAGTYTPFTLIALRGAWGWSLFGVVWTLAAIGIVLELRQIRQRGWLVALYVGMGWVIVAATGPLLASLSSTGLWLLLGGGISYTLGVPFYLWHRLPYNHAIWHLFVLGGSAPHFFAVLLYVLPSTV
ncbi:MAG: hemolysin III family protein [Dokdonella sp.]